MYRCQFGIGTVLVAEGCSNQPAKDMAEETGANVIPLGFPEPPIVERLVWGSEAGSREGSVQPANPLCHHVATSPASRSA